MLDVYCVGCLAWDSWFTSEGCTKLFPLLASLFSLSSSCSSSAHIDSAAVLLATESPFSTFIRLFRVKVTVTVTMAPAVTTADSSSSRTVLAFKIRIPILVQNTSQFNFLELYLEAGTCWNIYNLQYNICLILYNAIPSHWTLKSISGME